MNRRAAKRVIRCLEATIATATAVALCLAAWMCLAAPAVASEPIRIMPLGDSITRGAIIPAPGDVPGGYRTNLWKKLAIAGYAVRFVGEDISNPDPRGLPDPHHNGYKGWTIEQIDANIGRWLEKSKPDIVLLHIGTNDAFGKPRSEVISTRLDKLITHITSQSPRTCLIVAQIIDTKDVNIRDWIHAYNKLIPGIVQRHAKAGERVTMVNMAAAVPLSDFIDPYHPNKVGYDRMADAWFGAIHSLGLIGNDAALLHHNEVSNARAKP